MISFIKKDEYRCYICKKIYKKGLTDAEAEKQLVKEFGDNWITED